MKTSEIFLAVAFMLCLLCAAPGCAQTVKPKRTAPGGNSAARPSVKTIPLEIPITNQIYIQVRINNSELMWFLLDTGATWTIIDVDKAKELNIRSEGNLTLDMGQRHTVATTFAKDAVLELAGVKVAVPELAVMPVKFRHAPQIVGVVGSEVFKRYVVAIDYQTKTLNLFEPQSYHYTGPGQILPIELVEEYPHIMVTISRGKVDPVEARLGIDTGASQTVMLNGPFIEQNKLLETTEGTIKLSAGGLGGGNIIRRVRATSVKVGDIVFEHPLIDFSTGKGAGHDGVIGNGLLNRFKMITDYSRKRVILEPAEKMADPTDFDFFQFDLVSDGKNVKVSDVLQAAAAGIAGLKTGDVLLEIEGQSVANMSLTEIKRMFIWDGRDRVISVKRGAATLNIKIKTSRVS